MEKDRRKLSPVSFFALGLAFLWLRNAPLDLIIPHWSQGDEMAHFDYTMKIGRGQIPRPDELMERALFRLHKNRYDSRYLTPTPMPKISRPEDLGLAAYSYEAQQPPLPYLVFAVFRIPLKAAGLTLLAQVKALRIVVLLVVAAGLFILYRTLRRRPDLGPYWSAPLLLIPLLPQDMFFSINTDVFAFFFGCAAVGAIFRLFDRPLSTGRWAVLSFVVGLAMWTKATCAFFFALWPVLAVVLGRMVSGRAERRRITALAAVFFVAAGALSSPWYILNNARNSNIFGFQFEKEEKLPYKPFPPSPLNWENTKKFKRAFGVTLIRGEFLWNGLFMDNFPNPWDQIFVEIVFWLMFAAGLVSVFLRVPGTRAGPYLVLAVAGTGVIFSLFVLYIVWGGIPFYHARYAFAGLYPIILLLSAGWRRLIPDGRWAAAIPVVLLLGFNLSFTIRLLDNVL